MQLNKTVYKIELQKESAVIHDTGWLKVNRNQAEHHLDDLARQHDADKGILYKGAVTKKGVIKKSKTYFQKKAHSLPFIDEKGKMSDPDWFKKYMADDLSQKLQEISSSYKDTAYSDENIDKMQKDIGKALGEIDIDMNDHLEITAIPHPKRRTVTIDVTPKTVLGAQMLIMMGQQMKRGTTHD